MSVGKEDTLELFFSPIESSNYNHVKWSSSNPSVATVNNYGVITAIYTGSCDITATYSDKKATARIDVRPVNLDMKFSKAIAYFFGDYYKNGYNIYILRLLSDGYHIEPNGNIWGAGYYFTSELRLPLLSHLPSNASFSASEAPQPFTYMPGYIKQDGENLYASGTYLGFVSMNSNVATFVKQGTLNITQNSTNHSISGNFLGTKNELIAVNYSGSIDVFNRTITYRDTMTFNRGNNNVVNLGDCYNLGQNIFIAKFFDTKGNVLQVEFIAPLSATTIPTGNYRLNNGNNVFGLIASDITSTKGTLLIEKGVNKGIKYGSVNVSQAGAMKIFKIDLVTLDDVIIQ